MASTKPNVIFVLGGPGAGMMLLLLTGFNFSFFSGKGTQCARIAEVSLKTNFYR